MSWAEAKWIHDKLLQAMGRAPANMRKFSCEILSQSSIGLKFLEPEDSYVEGNISCAVGGVMIRMSDRGYPENIGEGTLVLDNTDLGKYENEAFVVDGLIEGKVYYFSAFPYSTQGVYKVSDVNRASVAPKDGEIVNVTINIDDDSAFDSVVVTCVNESKPALTQTVTLTATVRTGTFAVPGGDSYHIEYGEVEGYSKPDNSVSKVSVAGVITNYEVDYHHFTATIDVVYPVGATLTCSYDGTVYTATDDTGVYQFRVHKTGAWVIRAVKDGEDESVEVLITHYGQTVNVEVNFAKIYGISRNFTAASPVWARTDNAVGMSATGSIGTVAGSSDFDACYPWSGIVQTILDTNDVMVKIPKFYFARYREDDIEYIKIADKPTTGFKLHPAFNHGGVEKDAVYVGAYKTTSRNTSRPNGTPTVEHDKALLSGYAKDKGPGWGMTDISTVSAIQMLVLVEFANNDMQSVLGKGMISSSYYEEAQKIVPVSKIANGTGRAAGGDGSTEVAYRGIVGIWGNVNEWVEGVNVTGGEYYVCNDPSKYADNTTDNYEKLSYAANISGNGVYITALGLDTNGNEHILFPSATSGGSPTTYFCDAAWKGLPTGYTTMYRSGAVTTEGRAGIFTVGFNNRPNMGIVITGYRLQYIPQ
jgi:hypothetical protein